MKRELLLFAFLAVVLSASAQWYPETGKYENEKYSLSWDLSEYQEWVVKADSDYFFGYAESGYVFAIFKARDYNYKPTKAEIIDNINDFSRCLEDGFSIVSPLKSLSEIELDEKHLIYYHKSEIAFTQSIELDGRDEPFILQGCSYRYDHSVVTIATCMPQGYVFNFSPDMTLRVLLLRMVQAPSID